MNILHLGGFYPFVLTLAKYQKAAGHEVSVWRGSQQNGIFQEGVNAEYLAKRASEIKDRKFDIIHIHGLPNELEQQTKSISQSLGVIASTRTRLVYSSLGEDPVVSLVAKAPAIGSLLLSNFRHVFILDPENMTVAPACRSHSLIPMALDFERIKEVTLKYDEIRAILITAQVPADEQKFIISCVESLRAKRLRFEFNVIDPDSIRNVESLMTIIKDSNLLVERVGRESFGALAVLAMAFGVPVLSGNSEKSRSSWQHLQYCPNLDTNRENFTKRLESIIREPRCLRDLSKRGKQHVKHFHNAEIVTKTVLDVYEKLVE